MLFTASWNLLYYSPTSFPKPTVLQIHLFHLLYKSFKSVWHFQQELQNLQYKSIKCIWSISRYTFYIYSVPMLSQAVQTLFLLNTSCTWHTFLLTCLSNSSFYRNIRTTGLYTWLKDLKGNLNIWLNYQ